MFNAIITELFHAVDNRDWDVLARIFHPDIVYERPGYAPFVGIERLLQFYQHERILASGQHHLDQIVAENDHAACWGRFVGVKKDGQPADVQFADVYSFEDGKIKTRRSYFFQPSV
jgi:ketosteroid isomerase-like protein